MTETKSTTPWTDRNTMFLYDGQAFVPAEKVSRLEQSHERLKKQLLRLIERDELFGKASMSELEDARNYPWNPEMVEVAKLFLEARSALEQARSRYENTTRRKMAEPVP